MTDAIELKRKTFCPFLALPAGKDATVFVGKRVPLTAQGLQQIWKRCIRDADLPKQLSIHCARHTLATHLLRNGPGLQGDSRRVIVFHLVKVDVAEETGPSVGTETVGISLDELKKSAYAAASDDGEGTGTSDTSMSHSMRQPGDQRDSRC